MDLNKLKDFAFRTALEHGFHDVEYSDNHWIMLVITEISEAVEADRKGKRANVENLKSDDVRYNSCSDINGSFSRAFEKHIKDTVEDELADVAIRLLDFAGLRGIEFDNIRKNVRAEGESFTEKMLSLVKNLMLVTNSETPLTRGLAVLDTLDMIFNISEEMGIDIIWHIENKMTYNGIRTAMHGKKY